MRPAVRTGRCFVSFSGGRDSSAVLAAAAAVARREALPLPVPLTIRARAAPPSDESEFQESVVRHLGLDDWVRIDIHDELDAVGPYARRALSRHGLLWPFNAHFHSPMLEQAAGGTLLTGVGGDELWSSSSASHRSGCAAGCSSSRRAALRREVLARRDADRVPWLRPRARAPRSAPPATTPRRCRGPCASGWSSHGACATPQPAARRSTCSRPTRARRSRIRCSIWTSVVGLAAAAPRAGFAHADAALAAVAGRSCPRELISRRTKASFDAVFFNEHARAFARGMDRAAASRPRSSTQRRCARTGSDAPDPHSLTLCRPPGWRQPAIASTSRSVTSAVTPTAAGG